MRFSSKMQQLKGFEWTREKFFFKYIFATAKASYELNHLTFVREKKPTHFWTETNGARGPKTDHFSHHFAKSSSILPPTKVSILTLVDLFTSSG